MSVEVAPDLLPLNLDVSEWTDARLYQELQKTTDAVENNVGERREQLQRLVNHYCFEVHCRIVTP